MRRILPSITSHGCEASTWRDKIHEIEPLGIREIALFVTGLRAKARTICYDTLENLKVTHHFTIPFVHAVSDMPESEFQYLSDMFGTVLFNLHPTKEYPLQYPLSAEIRRRILIENTDINHPLEAGDLEGFAGICFDLSHLEDAKRSNPRIYHTQLELASEFPVAANHISAVSAEPNGMSGDKPLYSKHLAAADSEFGYLGSTPVSAFASICAVEVENPLVDQLRFIERIKAEITRTEHRQISSIGLQNSLVNP